MTSDVPFLRHVTSNQAYYFWIFSKFVNVVPTYLKIGTYIDWTYNMYIAKTYINKSNVTYVSMATKYSIIKHRAFFKTLTAAISPINTWSIAMKFRMDIPVLHDYFVWQPREHRSKVTVKVIKNIKTTVWTITFESDVLETSGWLQNVSNENTYQNYPAAMTYDKKDSSAGHVPFKSHYQCTMIRSQYFCWGEIQKYVMIVS